MTDLMPEPHWEALVRTSNADLIWQAGAPGEWYTRTPNGAAWFESWAELAGGKHGDLQLLIPVPYTPGVAGGEFPRQQIVEGVLEPFGRMAEQLAAALAAGVTSVVENVHRHAVAGTKNSSISCTCMQPVVGGSESGGEGG